jgi:hypothetical protein
MTILGNIWAGAEGRLALEATRLRAKYDENATNDCTDNDKFCGDQNNSIKFSQG